MKTNFLPSFGPLLCAGLLAIATGSSARAAMTVHLDFADSGTLNKNTGTVDTSGKWSAFSNVTQVTSTGTLNGYAASFTSGTSDAYMTSLTGVAAYSSMTLSFHLKTSDSREWASFAAFGDGPWSNQYWFAERKSGGSPDGFSLQPNGSPGGVSAPWVEERGWDMADGNWHHYAVTLDGTTIKLYLDGTLADSAAFAGTGNIAAFALNRRLGLSDDITAQMADYAIYDTALNAAQIDWLSENVAIGNPVPEPAAVALALFSGSALLMLRRRVRA